MATDSSKVCSHAKTPSAPSLGIPWVRFVWHNALYAVLAGILQLGWPQVVHADAYIDAPVQTQTSSDGWRNRQRFQWVAKPSESDAAIASEHERWFLWAFFAVALVSVGVVTMITLRRLKQANDSTPRKMDRAESFMAEDPSMVEFLQAMRDSCKSAAAATEPSPAPEVGPEGLLGAAKNLVTLWAGFVESNAVPGTEEHVKMLHKLMQTAEGIKEGCSLPHLRPARLLASALQGLLKQLSTRAENVTHSALRTSAAAIDLLELLCKRELRPDLLTEPPLRLLAVDDDPISRGMLSSALRKTFTEPELAPEGKTALILASQRRYDLVFLDVEMPGLDGFEVCSKIHLTGHNCATPVVFVTSHNDFDSRAKSALAGAHDLIGKPFLAFEITVKALTLVLKARVGQRDEKLDRNQVEIPTPGSTANPGAVAAASVVASPASATSGALPTTSSQESSKNASEAKMPAKPQPDPASSVSGSGTAPVVTASEPLNATEPQLSTPSSREFARAFFQGAPAHLQLLRTQLNSARDAAKPADRDESLDEVLIGVRSIYAEAERAKLNTVLRVISALEAVVKRLAKHPSYGTAAAALDALEQLCQSGQDLDLAQAPARLLVVDDDPVACRAIGISLQLAFGRPDSADCGEAALVLAADKPYDLIFVDVLMPGMDGFVTCEKLHKLARHRLTPVIFVTSLDDQDSRGKAAASGGCGFIPKPVLPCEILLVALTHIVRGRLERQGEAPWKDAVCVPAEEGVLAG